MSKRTHFIYINLDFNHQYYHIYDMHTSNKRGPEYTLYIKCSLTHILY